MSSHIASGPGAGARTRDQVVADLMEASRDMAGWTVLLHQAVAARFGLGPTDMKCLDLARGERDLTAGRLAEITGLSTSAVTSVVDRLERRGFVTRARDAKDRRKVLIRPTGTHDQEADEIFAQVAARFQAVLAGYTDAELEMINAFIHRLNEESSSLVPALTGR